MSLVAWLVVLFSIYTIGQFYAILRLGDRFEMDPDAGLHRPNVWNPPQNSDGATAVSTPPTQPASNLCPECGIPNDSGYAFCRHCASPLAD